MCLCLYVCLCVCPCVRVCECVCDCSEYDGVVGSYISTHFYLLSPNPTCLTSFISLKKHDDTLLALHRLTKRLDGSSVVLKVSTGQKFFFTVIMNSKNTKIGASENEIGRICGKLSELKSGDVCVVLKG